MKQIFLLILGLMAAQKMAGRNVKEYNGSKQHKKNKKVYPGIANNNPGNLRPLPNGQQWNGQTGVKNGYVVFSSMALGVRAMALNIENTVKGGFDTFTKFFNRYAPAGDNNTPSAYAATVATACNKGVNDTIEMPGDLYAMVNAMIRVENGNEYALVSQEDILNGINLA